MKAVIVEIRGKNAAALCDDGGIIKLKDRNYAVGQVIEHQPDHQYWKFAARIAGMVVALAMTATSAWAYYTPYSYVSLDVTNPSLAFSLNRFDRVLSCTAVNGDGAGIVSNLALKNKNIQEAIKMTVQEMAVQGYLTNEEPEEVVIVTSSADPHKSDQLAKKLNETATQAAAEKDVKVEVEVEKVGQKSVQKAKELGTTPGRLNLVQQLKASTEDHAKINTEEWVKKSVKDIKQQINEYKQGKASTGSQGKSAALISAPSNHKFPYYYPTQQQFWPWVRKDTDKNQADSNQQDPGKTDAFSPVNPFGQRWNDGQNFSDHNDAKNSRNGNNNQDASHDKNMNNRPDRKEDSPNRYDDKDARNSRVWNNRNERRDGYDR